MLCTYLCKIYANFMQKHANLLHTCFHSFWQFVKGHTWKFPQNSPQRFEGDLQIYLIAGLLIKRPNCDYPNVCPNALGDATMITSLIFYWCNLGFGQAINYFYISQMYEPNAWCHNSGGPFFRQTRVSMKLSFCRCNSFSLISERWIHSLVLIVSKAIAKKWIHHLMVFLNHGDF